MSVWVQPHSQCCQASMQQSRGQIWACEINLWLEGGGLAWPFEIHRPYSWGASAWKKVCLQKPPSKNAFWPWCHFHHFSHFQKVALPNFSPSKLSPGSQPPNLQSGCICQGVASWGFGSGLKMGRLGFLGKCLFFQAELICRPQIQVLQLAIVLQDFHLGRGKASEEEFSQILRASWHLVVLPNRKLRTPAGNATAADHL